MSLLTESNFFLVIIALFVIFFLLGFIIGRLTNRSDNITHVTPTADHIKENTRQTEALGQDNQILDQEFPDLRQNKKVNNNRYRYYNDYWYY